MKMNDKDIRIKRVIQRCGCDTILPLTLIYIFYIILHGHLSPGGGFQGGVLMTAVVILMYLGHGYKTTTRALSFNLLHEAEGFASTMYVALALMAWPWAHSFARMSCIPGARWGTCTAPAPFSG